MKKAVLIILNALLIMPFFIFFRHGGNVAISMFPIWFIMSIVNTAFAKDIKQLLLYNGCLSLFASIGIFVCGQLYLEYVRWDSMGEAITKAGIMIEIIYIAVLSGIESFIKSWK